MMKIIFTLLVVFTSLSSYGQSFEFKYFNQKTNKFEIEDWKYHQMIRWIEERDLLIPEVLSKETLIISLQNDNKLLTKDTASLGEEITTLNERVYIETKDKMFYKDLYDKSLEINVSGDRTINSVEWALKKEKIKNKWLSISTGVTTGVILTYLIIEIIKIK